MKPPVKFSDQLREARKRTGLSQPKCEYSLKLGTGQISAWETRRTTPHKIMQQGVLAKLREIETTTSPAVAAATACSAVVDAFREALKNGTLQQCNHGEWVTVDPEKIPVGYVARANHWRIIPQNVRRVATADENQSNQSEAP